MEIVRAGGFTEYLVSSVGVLNAEDSSSEQRLRSALVRLGVAAPGETLLAYEEWHNYRQLGGETYVAAAQVVVAGPQGIVARPFVSKAVVAGPHTLQRMLDRRERLAALGVLVPHLYSVTDACIVEQFIPYSVPDCLAQGQARGQVLEDVVHAAVLLDLHGFPTLSFLHDMRADGERAYYVDFGWDLWDPHDGPVSCAYRTLMDFARAHMRGWQREIEQRYRLMLLHLDSDGWDAPISPMSARTAVTRHRRASDEGRV